MSQQNKLLEVKNITKIYKIYKSNIDRLKELFTNKTYHREFVSNDNISFDLYESQSLGIIGVNGAGKSTILKIIAGVIAPSSGEIIKHGRVTALLELGTGFNDELNGHENIFLNGTLIGMEKEEIDKVLDDIISFSELGDYIYEPIRTYSSGMKMRLAFSIAIYSQPKILIVDEALSVGDAHFALKCTNALKQRKKNKMSIIYVSHDLGSLKLLCDKIILLNHGKMIEQGTPEDTINTYNFLIATLNEDEEKMLIKEEKKSSFGTFDVRIEKVAIKSLNANFISSGDTVSIQVHINSTEDISCMTVGIVIRDKFAQDIFGTNTFHHDMKIDLKKEKNYICNFSLPLNIGVGKYTITAAVHSNETHLQDCAHWLDHATSFEILDTIGNNFLGICKLNPTITFTQKDDDD